ncbi:hypothetical protein PN465_13120 [Nodularia spumigena CS-584]|nr:hypothetical protein [Nodularia spumigena]AHJ27716.1 hypothetical protein NSP_13760 [Nodularia spumigena CCY9414]MDB9383152.1 hypothetical protein [Nodularia spumigena CS-584]MEA5559268.1 hypothetical protein [Nodularia spumigena CH309]
MPKFPFFFFVPLRLCAFAPNALRARAYGTLRERFADAGADR